MLLSNYVPGSFHTCVFKALKRKNKCQSHYPPFPKKSELKNIRHMQLLFMLIVTAVRWNNRETDLLPGNRKKNNLTNNLCLTVIHLIKCVQQVGSLLAPTNHAFQ